MVTATDVRELDNGFYVKEFYGLSTDTKPTAMIANGSIFIEIDTADAYFFDEEHAVWLKVGASNA